MAECAVPISYTISCLSDICSYALVSPHPTLVIFRHQEVFKALNKREYVSDARQMYRIVRIQTQPFDHMNRKSANGIHQKRFNLAR